MQEAELDVEQLWRCGCLPCLHLGSLSIVAVALGCELQQGSWCMVPELLSPASMRDLQACIHVHLLLLAGSKVHHAQHACFMHSHVQT